MNHRPTRMCVSCRKRFEQAALVRFTRGKSGWRRDLRKIREPGRGAYLCSASCASDVKRNKRFADLAGIAAEVAWQGGQ